MRAAPLVSPGMMRTPYRPDGSGDALTPRFSSQVVALNVDRTLPGNALVLNIAGDWLFVDPSSVGYALARMDDTNDSGNETALYSGRVVRAPFRRVVLRHGLWPLVVPLALANAGTVPRMRILYGQGPCPFEETDCRRTVYAANVTLSAGNPAGVSGTFDCPMGAILDVTARGQQTNTAGGAAVLVPRLDLNVGGTILSGDIAPDSLDRIVGAAAASISYVGARWKDIVVPLRDSATDTPTMTGTGTVSVLDVGTETTNNVFFDEVTVLIR